MMSSFSNLSRFVSTESVIEALTKQRQLPASLKSVLCASLHLPEGVKVERLSVVETKGVGATQCRPYIIHFSNGEKRFLKLSPMVKKAAFEQKKADSTIQSEIGNIEDSPFVYMATFAIAKENSTLNEMLFFPFVPGDNLFITINKHQEEKRSMAQYREVGKSLAQVHITCMKKAGSYVAFLKGDGVLPFVLTHDDWQPTNIMITPDNKAFIVDTEGTKITDKPYRNIVESWELADQKPALMNSLLEGYMSLYPKENQNKILKNIHNILEKELGVKLQNTDELKVNEPMNPRKLT